MKRFGTKHNRQQLWWLLVAFCGPGLNQTQTTPCQQLPFTPRHPAHHGAASLLHPSICPQVCWRVACFFPGVTVAVMTCLNMFLWGTGSSGAIPLGFFFSIIFLW